MDLNKLYSLRNSFSVIGLTGRMGAGVSRAAGILSENFDKNDFERTKNRFHSFEESIELKRKFDIVFEFSKVNWDKSIHKVIKYKNVVFLRLLELENDVILDQTVSYFSKNFPASNIERSKLQKIFLKFKSVIEATRNLGPVDSSLNNDQLKNLADTFFSEEFTELCNEFYQELRISCGIVERLKFSAFLAENLRKYGKPFPLEQEIDYDNIYTVAESINRIIKGFKNNKPEGGTHIVIDSLKNSLEIMFFKERFSAFYMMAVNSDFRRDNLEYSLKKYQLDSKEITRMLKIDDNQYSGNHVKSNNFFKADVQNCIQKADIHLKYHNQLSTDNYISLHTQLLKYKALIQQPGIVKPSKLERCMQVAYTAKFNSGCISRQVGAAISDSGYSIKSIGWNDAPKGQISCLYRNVEDLVVGSSKVTGYDETYSEFERNDKISSKFEFKFKEKLKVHYPENTKESLEGRNCSFCFKSNYNQIIGEDNQVHTRSLHAEENAMLQISKKGGVGLEGGVLFTTASPCELCSKKAYQIGIKTVYYIDPYPGIAREQILKNGKRGPKLELFRGAIGQAYHKLYEPFMAYKDEVKIRTGYPKKPEEKKTFGITKESAKVISTDPELQKEVEELVANYKKRNK